jgi:O-antigen/teichoic acid export membrane protein
MDKTKNKGSNLGADATLLTFSKVATSAIAMVMTMMLSRVRSTDEYGTYSQILMVVNLVTSILMLGLPKSLNFFLARADSKEEKQRFLSLYYTLNTVLSLVVGLVLVLSVGVLEEIFDNTHKGTPNFCAADPAKISWRFSRYRFPFSQR